MESKCLPTNHLVIVEGKVVGQWRDLVDLLSLGGQRFFRKIWGIRCLLPRGSEGAAVSPAHR